MLNDVQKALKTAPISAWFGMIVIVFYIFLAFFAAAVAPYSETEIVSGAFDPWFGEYLFGTDNLGRDMLSRLIFGARNTIGIAFSATVLAFTLGGLMGMLAATFGGWVDQLFSRIVDVLMSIPSLIFALLLLTIFSGVGSVDLGLFVISDGMMKLIVLVVIIAVLDSTRVFRLTRAVAGNVVVMDYIEVARLRGEGVWWLIRREILPNILAPLIAEFGLRFCFVFLFIAALSFLGLGIQPPTADWGSMVRENAILITFATDDLTLGLTPLLPAFAIALLTIAINFVVDWMLHKSSGLKE